MVILGGFGWIWRPFFRIGESSSPYWLVRLYSYITPISTAVVLVLLVIFWFFGFIGRNFSKSGGKGMIEMTGLLRIGLIIAVIAVIPSFMVSHTHIESEVYNSGNYNLLREVSFGQTSLMLVECSDPGQMSCRTISRQNMAVPLPATEMPTRVVEIEGIEVILKPNYIPTSTPAVEFGVEASSGQLGVRVGNDWVIVATPEMTPTPVQVRNSSE